MVVVPAVSGCDRVVPGQMEAFGGERRGGGVFCKRDKGRHAAALPSSFQTKLSPHGLAPNAVVPELAVWCLGRFPRHNPWDTPKPQF